MTAQRLDGKACAAAVEEELHGRIKSLQSHGLEPHLAVIIVGNDPASHVYVNSKVRTCKRLGIRSTHLELPEDTSEETLREHILEMNSREDLHGILIQSPLPPHMDEGALTDLIDPSKDVDGFHPSNLGKIVQGRLDGMIPCTPAGVMRMLKWANIELSGKKAVVIGRSFNVGMTQALLLAAKGADSTVTIVHSRTQNPEEECKDADIVVAAVGRPEMVHSLIGLNRVLLLLMLESIALTMQHENVAGGWQAMLPQMFRRLRHGYHPYPAELGQ
jgi:methylenetetrahydrofolate dehydrogenase (NADP+)/methenyltetrahydrofolate cyclohydrolase